MSSAERRPAPTRADGPGARLSSGGWSSRSHLPHSTRPRSWPSLWNNVRWNLPEKAVPLLHTLSLQAPWHHLAIITWCAVSLLQPQHLLLLQWEYEPEQEMGIITVWSIRTFLFIITTLFTHILVKTGKPTYNRITGMRKMLQVTEKKEHRATCWTKLNL